MAVRIALSRFQRGLPGRQVRSASHESASMANFAGAWRVGLTLRDSEPHASHAAPASTNARSGWRVVLKGDFEGPLSRDSTPSNLGDAAEDRGMEITRATDIANADGNIFEDDKASL